MKKKRSTILRDSLTVLATIFFFLFCLCGAAYSLKLFYESLNASLTKMNEKPIATVTFKHKTAQRKFEERMVWDRLNQNSPVYNGDTIRTAGESEATIYFIDGNVIELGENTMAQIFLNDGKAQTSISEGEVVVNSSGAAGGAVVMFGDSRIELNSGASIGTNISKASGAKIDVMEGNALFSDENGTVKTLDEGKSLALNQNNVEQTIPIITVLQPRPNEKILNLSGSSCDVGFKWNAQNLANNDSLVLEIASDKKFQNIVQKKEVKNANEARANLKNGNFYWRIYPASGGIQYSAQSKLSVLDAPPPALVVPENKKSYSYKSVLPDIRFSWTQNDWATAFEFEVADNPEMNSPVVKQRITTPSSIVSTLGEGTWYWRVTPFYTINNTGLMAPSEVRSFNISKISSLGVAELIVPVQNDEINTKQKDLLAFSWKNNPEAVEYEIRISQDENFSSPKILQKVYSNFYSIKASENGMEEGTWYWCVTQRDKDGDVSQRSEVRKFVTNQLEYIQQILYPPDNFSTNNTEISEVQFLWKTNISGDTLFQIASDKNFKNIVFDEVNNTQHLTGVALAGGDYYWRIASKNLPELYSTAPRALKITTDLSVPVLVYPDEKAALNVTINGKNTFRWNEVPGATQYMFRLYAAEKPDAIIYSEALAKNNCTVDLAKFDEGNYIWSVQAVTGNAETNTKRYGAPGTRNITLWQVKPIRLTYPESGAMIDGTKALTTPTFIRWYSEQEAQNATFTLSRNKNGYSNPVVTIKNPGPEIKLNNIEPGTYYWTVRAQNKNGVDITPENANSFTMTKPRFLDDIKITEPADKKLYDVAIIRESRKIKFEWANVEGATNYTFAIRNRNGNVLISRNLTEPNFVLEDMADLGEGIFTWSVQAVALRNGELYAQSAVATRTFTIDLPKLKQVIVNDTGVLYGM